MAEKEQVKRERRLNGLFIGVVLATVAVIIVATVALILPPRPLQRWLTSVCSLLTALGTLTALLALNQGVNYQRRSSVRLFLGANLLVLLLNLGSVAVLLWGLALQPTQMHLGISLPLLAVLLALFGLNVWNTALAAAYQRRMPANPPDMAQVRYSAGAYSNPVMHPVGGDAVHYSKAEQRVSALPDVDHNANNYSSDTLRSGASYHSYTSSAQPRIETLKPAGSLHSVLTITSDL